MRQGKVHVETVFVPGLRASTRPLRFGTMRDQETINGPGTRSP
jgi:hypothetical protein